MTELNELDKAFFKQLREGKTLANEIRLRESIEEWRKLAEDLYNALSSARADAADSYWFDAADDAMKAFEEKK